MLKSIIEKNFYEIDKELEINRLPADIQKCKEHRKATSFRYFNKFNFLNFNNKTNKKINRCICCGYPTLNKKIYINENIDNFSKLGIGYTLYFKFILYLIILIWLFLILSINDIYFYYNGNFCRNNKDPEDFYKKLNSKSEYFNDFKDLDIKGIDQLSKTVEYYQIKLFFDFFCVSQIFLKNKDCIYYYYHNCWFNYNYKCRALANINFKNEFEKNICTENYYHTFSFINQIKSKETYSTKIFSIIKFLILLLFLELIKYFNKKDIKKYKYNLYNLSKISVLVENIHFREEMEDIEELKNQLIRSLTRNENIVVRNINLIYNCQYYLDIKKKINNLKEWRDIILFNKINMENLISINDNLISLNNKFIIEYKRIKNKDNKWFLHKAIISLNCLKMKKKLIKKEIILNNKKLKISRIFQPTDIIWKNFKYSKIFKFVLIIITYTWLILIMFIFFIFIFSVKLLNKSTDLKYDNINNLIKEIISKSISLIILLFNHIINKITMKLILISKPLTKTKILTRVSIISFKLKFINTSLITFTISLIVLKFYGRNSLVKGINSLFIANIFTFIIFNMLINFKEIISWIKRRKIINRTNLVNQKNANKIFQKKNFNIETQYSNLLNWTASAIFFSPIIPMILLYLLIILIAYYWVTKYLLIKNSNKIIKLSEEISKKIVSQCDFFILVYILGLINKDFLIAYINHLPLFISSKNKILIILVIIYEVGYYFQIKRFHKFRNSEYLLEKNNYDNIIDNEYFHYNLCNLAYRIQNSIKYNKIDSNFMALID